MDAKKTNPARARCGAIAGSYANANSTGGDCTSQVQFLGKPISAAEFARLRITVAYVVQRYSELGRDGFSVRFVAPEIDRAHLNSDQFVAEVAHGLLYLAQRCVGQPHLCHSRLIAHCFKTCTAAAIVACHIAEYSVRRIAGSPHAEIFRSKRGVVR